MSVAIETSASAGVRPLVIAIGNAMRGDDGAGLEVAARLGERLDELEQRVDLVRTRGDATALMERWRGRDLVIVIDAVQADAAAGRVIRVEALRDGLPADFSSASTHDFGLAQALELGELMGALPARLVFIGIVASDFTIGESLSDAVAGALDEATRRVLGELEEAGCTNNP